MLNELATTDPRVRVLRQNRNLGHAGNYQVVLEAAEGEYFMWLADDDWLDPGYVARCLAVLAEERGHDLGVRSGLLLRRWCPRRR